MAAPGGVRLNCVVQDVQGFKSRMSMNVAFIADYSLATPPAPLGNGLDTWATWALAVIAKIALMTNAKVVEQSLEFWWDIAQEPTSETGMYRLVTQRAELEFGDGKGQFFHLSIPAPVDALFLTSGQDNLIVVNPAASVLTNFQSAVAANGTQQALTGGSAVVVAGQTRGAGTWGSAFFGGQLRESKPRRRRVLQGQ